MVDVSVLILAKNEERNIEDCIKSCSFAQEIIVIDDYSIDESNGRRARSQSDSTWHEW